MPTDLHNLQNLPSVHNLDAEIVARYTDQPPRLPAELRRRIEASWEGAPVQLYALADLDHALRLTQVWVALGPGCLAVARPLERGDEWAIESVERPRIEAVREAPGLSASTLTLLGRPGDPPLAVLRYSHRQRRAFENLKFVLEEALEGRPVAPPDADEEYAASVARSIRDAQALVAGRRVAVIRRLLGYLAPYRRQLTLGMAAATLITVVSLVPPYLAGYLIDRVVRQAPEGRLGLVMILPVPLFCWAIYRHGEVLNRVFLRVWRKWSRLTDVLSDTMPGIRVVKAFNQEAREVARFVGHNNDVTDEINRLHALWTTFWPLLMLAVHATTIGVWVLAVPRLLGGGAALSAGTFVSFLLYTTMFVGPIEVIGQMARTMQRATTSAHRVFEVLDTEPEVTDAPQPVRLEPVRGRVTFEHVSFAYDGVRQVLRGVSFEVAPGELIGLVGPSGGGQTTIVNLIARF